MRTEGAAELADTKKAVIVLTTSVRSTDVGVQTS